jgi:hypothetical protein
VITEAKRDSITDGVTQNIAQLVGGREDYLFSTVQNKRKYLEYAGDIAQVPSSGVVSTATRWVFTRYLSYPEHKVYQSKEFIIPLEDDVEISVLKAGVVKVVRILVGILNLQKECIDKNNEHTKRRRPLSGST